MSKHVGEKCGKWADGDPDGRTDGESDGRTDGDPDGHHHTIWSEDGRIKIKTLTLI